jgi:small-conductance mechanosensitive channel
MYLQNTNTNSDTVGKVADNAGYISKVAYQSIENILINIVAQLPYIVAGLIVLVVFGLIGKIVKKIFLATSERTKLDLRLRILFSRLIGIAVFFVGFFTALTVVIPNFTFGNLIAGLGFSSFIIGFATKDILNNLFSGILILWQEPFKIGDYVFMDDHEGEVEYIGIRATNLKMFDGERILIPNGHMYSNPLIIRASGAARRMKIQVSIGYQSKIEQSKQKVLEALDNIEGVLKDPGPSIYVTNLGIEGISLTVYFWINPGESSPMELFDEVSTVINRTLRDSGVKLFPPTPLVLSDAANRSIGKKTEDEL